jgi:ADP-ribose pyrophosphatase YjhB (NUDIX family)
LVKRFEGDAWMDAVFKTQKGIFNYRAAGVWMENGYVLLHKQVQDEHWTLPGGRVNLMEDSKSAVQREIQEELGQKVEVNNLLWITENFFVYNQSPIHEVGLYYHIEAANNASFFNKDTFFGLEGERLLYKWFLINELEEIELYPEFLKAGLKRLPGTPEHVIIKQDS